MSSVLTASTKSNKRKSDGASSVPSKKAKTSSFKAALLVDTIIGEGHAFQVPDDEEEVYAVISQLAQYARSLEDGSIEAAKPVKSSAQLQKEAERVRATAVSGIKKQMSWKPSCKTGGAKWTYDGLCADENVFGLVLGLDGPPTFKAKKLTIPEFEKGFGHIRASARYSHLSITGNHVNLRYHPDTGEYKLSGSYGVGF